MGVTSGNKHTKRRQIKRKEEQVEKSDITVWADSVRLRDMKINRYLQGKKEVEHFWESQ